MAFFEGCPVGWGGVPTGAGLVDGEVDQEPWLQERVGGGVGAMAVPRKGEGWLFQKGASPGKGSRKGWLGGRGGDTGPRSKFRSIFVVSNVYKKEEKLRFLKDALWGGGYPPELAWWTG